MKWGLIFLAATLSGILSCQKENRGTDKSEPIVIELTAAETKAATETNNSALTILAKIDKIEKETGKADNVMISPLSLNIALAMTWNGAKNETKEQMQVFLGLSQYTPEEVNGYFQKMIKALPKTDSRVKLSIANAIWYNHNISLLESFQALNRIWFNAAIAQLDFAKPSSVDIINEWCSASTNGMIDSMIEEIDPATVMFLMNALYFKAPWTEPFDPDKTRNLPFYAADGNTKDVPMMNTEISCPFLSKEKYRAISLLYGNKAYSMSLILPEQGYTLSDLYEILQQDKEWLQLSTKPTPRKVKVFLPRFKFDYKIELNDILIGMGMDIPFDSKRADFSGIANTHPLRLFISKVLQKTAIEVNEEGSEAAAVTSVEMELTSMPSPTPEFRADRPFLFAITENSTGTILFIGKVEKP